MSERCALEATQLRAVKSAQDVQGSLRLASSEVVCIRTDVYIYMYRYAREGRIYVHIYIYIYYIYKLRSIEVVFVSGFVLRLCSFNSKTTALWHVSIHPGDQTSETSTSKSSHVFVYTVTEFSAPSQCSCEITKSLVQSVGFWKLRSGPYRCSSHAKDVNCEPTAAMTGGFDV